MTYWTSTGHLLPEDDISPPSVFKKKNKNKTKKSSHDPLCSLLMFHVCVRATLHTVQFGCWCFSPRKDDESHPFQFNSSADLNRMPSPETSSNNTNYSHRSHCFCLMCCPILGSVSYPRVGETSVRYKPLLSWGLSSCCSPSAMGRKRDDGERK